MNSLDQRIKRLEKFQSVEDTPQSLTEKMEPVRSMSTHIKKNDVMLEKSIKENIERERSRYINKEMEKIRIHFVQGYSREVECITSVLDYTIKYIEYNGEKIARLMDCVCTSAFKLNTCVTFLKMFKVAELYDNEVVVELINYTVSLLFVKIIDVLGDPITQPTSNIEHKKKKGFFRLK